MSVSASSPPSPRAIASRRWCGVSLRPAEQHPTARGALAALAGAMNDQVVLELGEPAQHRQDQPAVRPERPKAGALLADLSGCTARSEVMATNRLTSLAAITAMRRPTLICSSAKKPAALDAPQRSSLQSPL